MDLSWCCAVDELGGGVDGVGKWKELVTCGWEETERKEYMSN